LHRSGFGVLTFFFGLFLFSISELGFQTSDALFGFKIPDHDSGGSSSAQPITDGRKAQSVDDITSFQRRKVVAQVEVPEHGSTVLATRSTQRAIGRDGDGVNVTGVTHKIGAKFAVVEVPDLDDTVPTCRDDQRNLEIRGKANTTNPFFVAIFLDGIFALTESVPQVDGSIARTRHDLTVISREGNRKDILGVSNEAASGSTTVEVPETKSTIARTRQSELTVGGDGNILNEVRVTS